MITLKNHNLTVNIDENGAEIKSIFCNGIENMWDGNPEIWNNSAPVLFPICGSLKDNKYIYDGKEYTLEKHGYAKNTIFDIELLTETKVIFLHKSTNETKKCFPFDYEFRVVYEIEKSCVKIEYNILNTSNKTMYFSTGSHEAYSTPEGIEAYDIIFSKNENLESMSIYNGLISTETKPVLKDNNILPLCEKYFEKGSLIFKNLNSDSIVLRNRKTGRALKIEFDYAQYFIIWHKPNANFICLEPWAGLTDMVDSSYEIKEKEGIIALTSGKDYIARHTITVL